MFADPYISKPSQDNTQFKTNFHAAFFPQHKKFNRTRESVEEERRLNLIGKLSEAKPYSLHQENKRDPNTYRCQAFTGIHETTTLNQVFLSPENINLVQGLIRYSVWQQSGKKHNIGRQNDDDLLIIMRSIYFQYAKNIQGNYKEQINELNRLVVLEATPRILSEIEAHLNYLEDASTMYTPLEHPTNLSNAGRKQLPSVTSVFF